MQHMSLVMLLSVILRSGGVTQDAPAYPPPPKDVKSVVVLAPEGEPGLPLVITGKIYHADRTTPFAGLLLYAYQTDATGEYHRDRKTRIPRINGWVRTNEKGEYEIRTIRPASYPQSRVVAHIHAFVRFPDGRRVWIRDFLFADDPYLSRNAKEKAAADGRFSAVIKTNREHDVLYGTRDIVIADHEPIPDSSGSRNFFPGR